MNTMTITVCVLWCVTVYTSEMRTRCLVQRQELEADDNDVYEVQKIIDQRKSAAGEWEYRVVWKGWPGQDTWETVKHIRGRGDEALEAFQKDLDPQPKGKKRKTSKRKNW